MATAAQRKKHETWLQELTSLPTAAGREQRVTAWIENWVNRRKGLHLRRDRAGNLLITPVDRGNGAPIFFQAHLDHPAFVVRSIEDATHVELEFRGNVYDPYFDGAQIEIFDEDDAAHRGTIVELDAFAKPFKRVQVKLKRGTNTLQEGDVGRWVFSSRGKLPRITKGILHTHACDDLAAATAALCALDLTYKKKDPPNIGVFFTRAEEVGFIGTLSACRWRSVPMNARLLCLENSRSFPESPIGGGPILRVGDKASVFSPELTNHLSRLLAAHAAKDEDFRWQRKLMPGGTCEATAFTAFGYNSTCICLPLGNYHNMQGIDDILAGGGPAKVGAEYIAVDDFHQMVDMLHICAVQMDTVRLPSMKSRLATLLRDYGHVLQS